MSDAEHALFLPGPAGRIEARFTPCRGARAAALVCHPHPQHGGTMYSKVAFRAGRALSAAGLSVLRFNYRGVGASEGSFDEGRGEREDTAAMIAHLARDHDDILVAGFSFGAWIALDTGGHDARVRRLIGIGLPVNVFDFGFFERVNKPALLVHGERDEWGDLHRVRALASSSRVGLHVVTGADHFFGGQLGAMMEAVTTFAMAG